VNLFVLVGGWPAAGKTTLARALAVQLGIAYLSKDEVKEALMDEVGAPVSVEESRKLGVAAVVAVLRAARGCPAAVIDSTWYPSPCHWFASFLARWWRSAVESKSVQRASATGTAGETSAI